MAVITGKLFGQWVQWVQQVPGLWLHEVSQGNCIYELPHGVWTEDC